MPIKYLPPTHPVSIKEFVEPVATDSFIWWLFRFRCVCCHQPATEINEIIPRSRSKKSIEDWENRVTMCTSCHREYHNKGVNNRTMNELRQKRVDFLKAFDREEYLFNDAQTTS